MGKHGWTWKAPSSASRTDARWLYAKAFGASAVCCLVLLALGAFHSPSALATSETHCPNEQLRAEDNSLALPDCRAYELVTPPDKNGAELEDLFLRDVPTQVASDGERVIALSIQCFADPEGCTGNRKTEGDPYLFSRTPTGWVTQPLAPPATEYEDNSWYSLNANDGTALFSAPSAPESETDDFLARHGIEPITNLGPLGEHVSNLGTGSNEQPPNYRAMEVYGYVATADLSHVVYETDGPVWTFGAGEYGTGLYEYAGPARVPLLVGVTGGPGSTTLASECGTAMGNGYPNARKRYGSLSEDGRVVYFTALGRSNASCTEKAAVAPSTDELYARVDGEASDARSVSLSEDPPVASCKEAACKENTTKPEDFRDAYFEGASADGSVVLFTDTQQLTDAATEASGSAAEGRCHVLGGPGEGGCNLYESSCAGCDEVSAGEEAGRRGLIDVSEENGGGPVAGGPRVQGVMAISADGSHVYFVAKGVLTGTEENQDHEHAENEAENLYLYAEGRRVFVARLSSKEENSEAGDDGEQWGDNKLIANVSRDGRFLVFRSHRALTGDDTREEGPAQVYEYDAVTQTMVRVSVGEDGYNDDGNAGVGNAQIAFGDLDGFGSVPVRSDPTMSDDGSYVFFESPVALVPGAVNDVPVGSEGSATLDEGFAQNVYEWHEGRVSLVSDGRDVTPTGGGGAAGQLSPVELLGVDESGANVFFATFDALTSGDTDTQRDFYDARVDGGFPAPVSTPVCEGEACQGAPSAAPSLSSPASLTFTGAGNVAPLATSASKPTVKKLTRCRRGFVRGRGGRCIKSTKKKRAERPSHRKEAR